MAAEWLRSDLSARGDERVRRVDRVIHVLEMGLSDLRPVQEARVQWRR